VNIINQIETLLETEKYDFLRNSPYLGDNIIFLTLGGSHAYGTNIETSDIDVRGVTHNPANTLIGLQQFEQMTDNPTDTVVYSFSKLISLILNCNPNTIELLGCKPEHYFVMTDIGREIIANQKLFLSKRAVNSFGGYATAQLHRLQNALARDKYTQPEKEEHILGSCKRTLMTFAEKYTDFDEGSIKLFIDKSDEPDLETEIFADISLKRYPLRDYKAIISEMSNIVRDYSKINHRNNKKDDLHLNKHAMHLVRLYLMCFDILEKEQIITYRENDLDLLMSIRNGEFQKPAGTYAQDFFDLIGDYEKRLAYAAENTALPKNPDYKRVEEFVMSVNMRNLQAADF
jgi:predicted nucleotidyltransferase